MSAVVFEKASTHLAPPTRHLHQSAKANQPDTALYSSVRQTSGTLPGQTCRWTIREHCAQLFQGYLATRGVLPDDPDSHGREPLSTQHRPAHGIEVSSGSRTMATVEAAIVQYRA